MTSDDSAFAKFANAVAPLSEEEKQKEMQQRIAFREAIREAIEALRRHYGN